MATGFGPSAADSCGDERHEDQPQEQPSNRPPRATRQPHRGGYDCEFVKPPSADFPQTDCPVCLLVLREPHQASCCGNSYCEACVKRVQDDRKPCPSCNNGDFTVFPDKRLKRSLYALNVYCSQQKEGCEWTGELLELDRHLNLQPPPEKLLVGCQFAEVACTYCAQTFRRRYVQTHKSLNCPKRPYTCQHCKKHEATFEDVTQNHWPVCPLFPVSCPNSCGLVLQRQGLQDHVSRDCQLTLVQCDFHVVGCQEPVTRRDMLSHINNNLNGHMSLLQMYMTTHPGENMSTCLWLMVGSIQKLVIENASIRSESQETKKELREACSRLKRTQEELHRSQEAIAQLEKTVASQSQMIATHAKELEEKTHVQEAILHQDENAEKVMCTGTLPFDFTMTDYEQYKRANKEWHSPPFYTHTHGYKMCIRVEANGTGSGKGTHLSVYGYLMRGEFDQSLHWPYQGSITIELLNQLEDKNHHTCTIDFTTTTNPKIINKVVHRGKAATGLGKAVFLSHSQLNQSIDRKCQYLRDNRLKFRISSATLLVWQKD